jgi:hypothetical protein
LIHLRLAKTGIMWRYESYLMVAGVIGIAPFPNGALRHLAGLGKPAALEHTHQKLFGKFAVPDLSSSRSQR